jgi:membrane-associated phospholipid phosphatase
VAAFGLLIAIGLGLWRIARSAEGLDNQLIANVVRDRTRSLTTAAHVASTLGRSWVLIAATMVLGRVLYPRLGWRSLAPLIAVVGAEQLQNVIKWIVDRPRPAVPHLEHVTGSSFPSGHATESAAVGVALILLMRDVSRYQRLAGAVAITALVVAISASRVYLSVHYPTDVTAGILLGSAWGATATWWCTNACRDPPVGAVSREGPLGSPTPPA